MNMIRPNPSFPKGRLPPLTPSRGSSYNFIAMMEMGND